MPVKTEEVDDPTTTTHITNGGGKTGGGGEGVAAGHRKSKVKCPLSTAVLCSVVVESSCIFWWFEVRPDGFTSQLQHQTTPPSFPPCRLSDTLAV